MLNFCYVINQKIESQRQRKEEKRNEKKKKIIKSKKMRKLFLLDDVYLSSLVLFYFFLNEKPISLDPKLYILTIVFLYLNEIIKYV